MKLVNNTKWSTVDLRALVSAARAAMSTPVHVPTMLHITNGRTLYPRWRRWGNEGRTAKITVCVPTAKVVAPSVVDLIGAIETGLRLPDLVIERFAENLAEAMGAELGSTPVKDVRLAPPPPKKERVQGATLQRAKLEGLRAKLGVWTPKLKRAQTKVKKLTREIKRRERLLAQLEAT